jgi:hypothetical protein
MIPALGPSQTAILAWLKEHPGSTSREVGMALYDQTSSCSLKNCSDRDYHLSSRIVRDSDRALWASRILQKLKRRGLVDLSDYNNPHWSVK